MLWQCDLQQLWAASHGHQPGARHCAGWAGTPTTRQKHRACSNRTLEQDEGMHSLLQAQNVDALVESRSLVQQVGRAWCCLHPMHLPG